MPPAAAIDFALGWQAVDGDANALSSFDARVAAAID